MDSFKKTYDMVDERLGKECKVVTTLIGLAVPIAMIAMGAIYKDKCPAEKSIAIYLIVAGIFIFIITVLRLAVKRLLPDLDGKVPLACSVISAIIGIFLLAWFIAGNVWVYGLYGKYEPTDTTADNYCKREFYWFAFCLITAGYILLVLCIIVYACVEYCRN